MVLVIILMSKSGFEDEVLIKLIVGVVKHVTIDLILILVVRILLLLLLRRPRDHAPRQEHDDASYIMYHIYL
jgi:hypothetical protein